MTRSSREQVDWTTSDGAERLRFLLGRSRVPESYKDAVWDRCQCADDLSGWREHGGRLAGQGRGVLLFGPVGTGKSSAAALLVGEVVKAGWSAQWFYTPDLCDRLLDGSRSRGEARQMHLRYDLVVLDDFGVRPFSDWEIGLLDQIVENRYRRRKSMVVTTNMPVQGMRDDDRLRRMVDRWRERCDAVVIKGRSMRRYT